MAQDVWLVEHSTLFREALKAVLRGSEFEVTREATDTDALAPAPSSTSLPALIIISVDSLDAVDENATEIHRICESYGVPVVLLADAFSLEDLRSVMRAGASAYLLRDVSPDVLKQSMALVMAGEKVLPSGVLNLLTSAPTEGKRVKAPPAVRLSDVETHVLMGLSKGHSNKEIAREFALSAHEVKLRVKTVFAKIKVQNRTEAAIWARENDW
jgi:two-component system, NarL family, nitrate/nitrite response regulator NarL